MSEDVLITVGGFIVGCFYELSGIWVEFTGCVPNGGVIFGGIETFAFFCNDMKEFRSGDTSNIL